MKAPALMLGVRAALAAGLCCGAAAQPSGAQDSAAAPAPAAEAAGAPVEARDGVEVYDAGFFAVYNPVTALDMVRRIPGFSISSGGGGGGGGFGGGANFDGGQRRGFTANASNVIVNGERASSKTGIEDQLDRISAGNVVRLELIRGAGLANLDVRGQTQVVNVVLAPGASIGATTTYIAELRYGAESERVSHELQLSRAQRLLGGDVQFNLRLPSDQEWGEQTETVRDIDRDIVEIRREHNTRDRYPIEVSGNGAWTPTARDTFNLNGEYQTWTNQQDFESYVFDGSDDQVGTEFRVTEETDAYNGEIGGDWDHVFNDVFSVKLLGLLTQRDGTNATYERTYAPIAFNDATDLVSQSQSGERIARATATWIASGSHTLESGAELAFNYLDSGFQLETVNEDGTPNGVFSSADDTRVEELRGEAFISDVWVVNPRLTVESAFVFEASRISQIRDDGEPYEREFTFPKPRITATYSRASGDQFRLRIERDVGQLNFNDFATNVNLGDDRTESGNPELEPEQAWKSSLQWERRFGARGAFTLEGFYELYESKQDRVPIYIAGRAAPLDGSGNLGDGVKYGVRADATIPLDFMFVPNAELRVRGARSMSEVDDGLTGQTRMFSTDNEWFYNVDFRQDLQGLGLAWGAGYNRDGIREIFRATEIHRFGNLDGFLTAFVETTRITGVTVRLQVENLNDSQFYRLRSMWRTGSQTVEAPRDLTPPDFTEERARAMTPVYSLRISGAF